MPIGIMSMGFFDRRLSGSSSDLICKQCAAPFLLPAHAMMPLLTLTAVRCPLITACAEEVSVALPSSIQR